MAATATTSLKNWKFQEQHVQQNLRGGDFIGSHSIILCATAPKLADLAMGFTPTPNTSTSDVNLNPSTAETSFALPIGVVDTVGMSQDRQLAQIFEIGSKRSYFLSARTLGSMQLSRVFYNGASLLRMLYTYYPASKLSPSGASAGNSLDNAMRDNSGSAATSLGDKPIGLNGDMEKTLPTIKNNPGYEDLFLNLDSDLFSQPLGLVMYIKDNNERDVGAIFLEECQVQNHSWQYSANGVVVAENVTMRFERVVPLKVNRFQTNQAGDIAAPTTTSTGTGNSGASPLSALTGIIQNPIGTLTSQLGGLTGLFG